MFDFPAVNHKINIMSEKKAYSVTYEHRHGMDHYLVRSDHFPEDEEIIEALGLDFEPGELLTVVQMTPRDFVDIPDKT